MTTGCTNKGNTGREFVISRIFGAPRELVCGNAGPNANA